MTNIFDKIREQYKDKEQLFDDMLSSMHIEAEKTKHNCYLLYDCDRNEYLDDGLCDSKEQIVDRLDTLIDIFFADELIRELNIYYCGGYDELLEELEKLPIQQIEIYSFEIAVIMMMADRL